MDRIEIINSLIKKNGYKSYLEIGVQNGVCFRAIEVRYKCGVDPDPESQATVVMTSDDFFHQNGEEGFIERKFDIIFVDGFHHADNVYRDIENSLLCLNEGGTIIVHDCNPKKELHQRVPRESKVWNGDVWKAWMGIRINHSGLKMCVVDTDHGCGIIRVEGNKGMLILSHTLLTYENFDKNRKEWLNLISIEEFKQNYL